jgi:hypothetical protein
MGRIGSFICFTNPIDARGQRRDAAAIFWGIIMVDGGPMVLRVASEADAWDALKWLLANRREADKAELDLTDLSWGHFNVTYRGDIFHQTVTASIMRGLVEYQNDLYRAFARVLKDDGRVTRLTDEEKADFELVFEVREGSTALIGEAAKIAGALSGAVKKMTGRQTLIAILVLLLLAFSGYGLSAYFQYTVDMRKIESEEKGRQYDLQERKDLYDLLERLTAPGASTPDAGKTLGSALKASGSAAEVLDHLRHGYDEIVRSAGGVDQLVIQDTEISAAVIKEITKSSRATSEKIMVRGTFTVTAVESDDPRSYTVHLENDDEVIIAKLEDPLVSKRYANAIANAEWSGNPVVVHMTARRVGTLIRDATITKAYAPRSRKA